MKNKQVRIGRRHSSFSNRLIKKVEEELLKHDKEEPQEDNFVEILDSKKVLPEEQRIVLDENQEIVNVDPNDYITLLIRYDIALKNCELSLQGVKENNSKLNFINDNFLSETNLKKGVNNSWNVIGLLSAGDVIVTDWQDAPKKANHLYYVDNKKDNFYFVMSEKGHKTVVSLSTARNWGWNKYDGKNEIEEFPKSGYITID